MFYKTLHLDFNLEAWNDSKWQSFWFIIVNWMAIPEPIQLLEMFVELRKPKLGPHTVDIHTVNVFLWETKPCISYSVDYMVL